MSGVYANYVTSVSNFLSCIITVCFIAELYTKNGGMKFSSEELLVGKLLKKTGVSA